MNTVHGFINKFYDVREGEWRAASLMFGLHFMLMVSLYLLKPARDSLFLSTVGPQQLPYMYLLLAIVAVPVSLGVSRLVQQYRSRRVLTASLFFYGLNLIVLRLLFSLGARWVYVVFYVWVGIFGILVISQFWLYANALFDAPQSKRLFPFLNLGAILGAIAGSEGTGFIVWLVNVDTENLLFISMVALLVCWVMIRRTKAPESPQNEAPAPSHDDDFMSSSANVLRTIATSRYQLLIVGIIASAMVVSTLIDYQFKTLATQRFADTAALTAFMGSFYGGMSVLSLIIQALVSAPVIRKLGLGGAILARPTSIIIGVILFALEPVLATAVFMQGVNRAGKYSIDKTGRELLFLPLPQHVKEKTKVFIDIFVTRFSGGVAGLLLLVLVVQLQLNVHQVTYAVAAMVCCWAGLSIIARRAYINRFRQSLRKRYVDVGSLSIDLQESVAHEAVAEMLQSANTHRILYGLSLITPQQAPLIRAELQNLLHYNHPEVRLRVLKLLKDDASAELKQTVEQFLDHADAEVQLEAIAFLTPNESPSPRRQLQYYLAHTSNSRVKQLAMDAPAAVGNTALGKAFITATVQQSHEDTVVLRALVAACLRDYGNKRAAIRFLKQLLQHRAPAIINRTLESMQALGADDFLPSLFGMLENHDYAKQVQRVLADYGPPYFDDMRLVFEDTTTSFFVRRNIPGIFAEIETQASVNYLSSLLRQQNPQLRYHVIKELNSLRKRRPILTFNTPQIRATLKREARDYFELLAVKQHQRTDIANNILIISLNQKMDQAIERMFRLAGLLNDQDDIYGSYLALRSEDEQANAASIEFVDNILDSKDKQYIFPIIDNLSDAEKLQRGRELFNVHIANYEEAMLQLLTANDLWLKACALFTVSADCPHSLQQKLQQAATDDENPLIKETAVYALNRNRS